MSTKLLTAIILTAVAILAANPPAVNYYSASDLQAMGQKLGTYLQPCEIQERGPREIRLWQLHDARPSRGKRFGRAT